MSVASNLPDDFSWRAFDRYYASDRCPWHNCDLDMDGQCEQCNETTFYESDPQTETEEG